MSNSEDDSFEAIRVLVLVAASIVHQLISLPLLLLQVLGVGPYGSPSEFRRAVGEFSSLRALSRAIRQQLRSELLGFATLAAKNGRGHPLAQFDFHRNVNPLIT